VSVVEDGISRVYSRFLFRFFRANAFTFFFVHQPLARLSNAFVYGMAFEVARSWDGNRDPAYPAL